MNWNNIDAHSVGGRHRTDPLIKKIQKHFLSEKMKPVLYLQN